MNKIKLRIMSATNKRINKKEVLPYMPDDERDMFGELLHIQAHSNNEKRITKYLKEKLGELGVEYSVDTLGNILAVKGSAEYYPCIVSHLDTVHNIHKDFNVYYMTGEGRHTVYAKSNKKYVGCGGDDKCGIYACLHLLKKMDNVKVAFFSMEEAGCVGSNGVDMGWFKDVGYIIQLDRWGRGDFINSYWGENTTSREYQAEVRQIMKKYGYSSEEGLITDSIALWSRGIGVSCVNVSCGYYMHHTNDEIIDLNEFWNSLLFTHEIVVALGEEQYESRPDMTGYNGYGAGRVYGRYYGYRTDKSYKDSSDDFFNKWKWDYEKAAYVANPDYKLESDDGDERLTDYEMDAVVFRAMESFCNSEYDMDMYDLYEWLYLLEEDELYEDIIKPIQDRISEYAGWYDMPTVKVNNRGDLLDWLYKYEQSEEASN